MIFFLFLCFDRQSLLPEFVPKFPEKFASVWFFVALLSLSLLRFMLELIIKFQWFNFWTFIYSNSRVDIWRDRRSCKILASRVNLSENNAKCPAILPQNKATALDLITIDAWHRGMWVMFLLPFNILCKVCTSIKQHT